MKDTFKLHGSECIGVKVRDKMYDVYTRIASLYGDKIRLHLYSEQKKSKIPTNRRGHATTIEDAEDILKDLSQAFRMLMRLFLSDSKIHLAAIFDKVQKLLVGFFDGMFTYQEHLVRR